MVYRSAKKCPCGSVHQKNLSKISGPYLDRIDIQREVPALSSPELLSQSPFEHSQDIKKWLTQVRLTQHKRFQYSSILTNAHMNQKQVQEFLPLTHREKDL